jgi:hypothetical protein
MTKRVVPMIHVPDVQATVAWYESIGFAVLNSFVDSGEMNWALVSLGNSELMFNAGGHPSTALDARWPCTFMSRTSTLCSKA